MVVALLVALATVPMLAAVLAGSASLHKGSKPRAPFVAEAPQDPVVVPVPGATAGPSAEPPATEPPAAEPPASGQDPVPGTPLPGGVEEDPLPPWPNHPPSAGRREWAPESGQGGRPGRGSGWAPGPGLGNGAGNGPGNGSGSGPGHDPAPPPRPNPGGGGPECTLAPESTEPQNREGDGPRSGDNGTEDVIDLVGSLLGGLAGAG